MKLSKKSAREFLAFYNRIVDARNRMRGESNLAAQGAVLVARERLEEMSREAKIAIEFNPLSFAVEIKGGAS